MTGAFSCQCLNLCQSNLVLKETIWVCYIVLWLWFCIFLQGLSALRVKPGYASRCITNLVDVKQVLNHLMSRNEHPRQANSTYGSIHLKLRLRKICGLLLVCTWKILELCHQEEIYGSGPKPHNDHVSKKPALPALWYAAHIQHCT